MKSRRGQSWSSRIGKAAAGACAILALGAALTTSAEAHHWRRHYWRHVHHYAHASPAVVPGGPAFAAIVVDENTGRTLYSFDENELRHPASITKVMTLYLLFEKLAKGEMTLETRLPVSEHAAAQEPSKLGVEAGDSISVDDAIKAIVTRSANDVAVAIAEAIGGDETSFAQMMTRKARALGMSRTVYRNASGLPNDEQVTTAHDLAILARATEEHFPRYFRYFSTHEFEYDGEIIGNHNHLLGRVDGVDGIKTGFTRASGFNLLTSLHRDGRSLVAVVLGGRSAGQRDQIMESLLEQHFAQASAGARTAPMIADVDDTEDQAKPIRPLALSSAASPSARPEAILEAAPVLPPERAPEAKSEVLKDAAPALLPVRIASSPADTMADGFNVTAPSPPISAARGNAKSVVVASAAPAKTIEQGDADEDEAEDTGPASRPTGPPALPPKRATDTLADARAAGWSVGPQPAPQALVKTAALAPAVPDPRPDAEAGETRAQGTTTASDEAKDDKDGWVIQIGATDDQSKAADLLARARAQNKGLLASAKPLTERVQHGGDVFYRARFAMLDSEKAESACRSLKKSGFSCFASHD